MSQKRNLPSWMSSRDPEITPSKSHCKKPKDEGPTEEHNSRNAPSNKSEHAEPSSNTTEFSKLMEGVVFVLSGFVNPERSTLRSQALTMGATYQPDWNAGSTLLICAFPNTPKFRQVETNGGTIISKEWITECYAQKKLVDIEQYLMHAGKPWRKSSSPQDANREKREHLSKKPEKQVEKKTETRGTPSTSSKNRSACNLVKEPFSVTEVKKWARDDLSQTISWLESQEEKPEPGEIKRIAAEGVLTCLQDAIDSLEQKQDIGSVTELWSFVPRVVKELGKMESSSKKENSTASKEEVCKQAKSWKKIYEAELAKPGEDESTSRVACGYDSDMTVEMTEEEIELAYRNVSLECL
ncbi:BRCT domain [Arabidopsis thaliana x Arabidopsis arenosa]|uniref:BRCT domain n=3 Tax=Arabidopsis TaxID=3701 RepID=A0A8T2HJM9_ARASU|nr:putative DNA repair protein XRCC1 [Arabidopsis thaliana]KAG7652575.1 BRCT domain [Arabidopsis thaliana x Arabidopsis arenosa]KAG7660258.1 BRCT domain [Arabidopsis suecica]KAG7652576.1 BRCT domain [Arabidopsis thaliana x Arabidopsis arenosa]KAG7652577.1 BRCT domain [Arabidopsis thaliana x Arabidopsis arenosa]